MRNEVYVKAEHFVKRPFTRKGLGSREGDETVVFTA